MGKIYKATKKAFYKNRQIDVGDEVEFTPIKGQGLPTWLLQRDKFGKPTNQIDFVPLKKIKPGKVGDVVKAENITSADVQKEYNKAKADLDKQLADLQEQRAAFEAEKEAWEEGGKDTPDAEPETESTDVEEVDEDEEVEESEPDDSGFVYTKEAPATTKAKARATPKAKGGAKKVATSKDEEIF